MRLRSRAEQWPFHCDVRAAGVDGLAHAAGALDQSIAQIGAERVGEAHVDNDAVAKERGRSAAPRAIDDLVRHDHVSGNNLLPERTNSRNGDDALNAKCLQRPDVRPHRNLVRHQPVPHAVSRQKRDSLSMQCADDDLIRRVSERGGRRPTFNITQAGHPVEPRAADYGQLRARIWARHWRVLTDSVDQQRDDVLRMQTFTPVQRFEFDQECDGGDLCARLQHQLQRCFGGPARREQIVDQCDPRAVT